MSDAFDAQRRRLFAIAYRMLGSVMDAEDIVQEAFLRWRSVDQASIRNVDGFLSTMVTRLCIDQLRSARVQRETYIGPWLPEPLLTTGEEPESSAALAESLTMAFLTMLERLAPVERAVYLLHEVFDYGYAEIALIVDKSEAACRQIVSRAKKHVENERPSVDMAGAEATAARMAEAMASGDLQGLMMMLAPDVELASDGGGKVHAATRIISGRERVATFLVAIQKNLTAESQLHFRLVNGQPGVVLTTSGKVTMVGTMSMRAEGVRTVHLVVNPDKLSQVKL